MLQIRSLDSCKFRLGRFYGVAAAILLIASTLMLTSCMDMGVQGGSEPVSSRFTGISSATAISPTTVTVTWPPLANYSSYTIYVSSKDSPVATIPVGSSYDVTGLSPNTTYSFSVVGKDTSGNQYGVGAQLQATTWANFLGPTSATATGYQSISLNWDYQEGPTFMIFSSIGSPPVIATGNPATLANPQYSTTSAKGFTVGGLQPNTNYYFMVVAKYADGSTSWKNAQLTSAQATAVYVSTGGLVTRPVITTQTSITSSTAPIFNVSNSVGTYLTTFKHGTTILGSILGNGILTATSTLPVGADTVTVTISDSLTSTSAYAAIDINVTTTQPNGGLKAVNAQTPSNLDPVPTITVNTVAYSITGPTPNATPINLGAFPAFVVSNAQPGYVTTVYNGGTILGQISGNGTIKTVSSAPLPQGLNTLHAVVTYGGSLAQIDNIRVYIKMLDANPVQQPSMVNGGIGQQGAGYWTAVGDFNCDGVPDLSISAPWGLGSTPRAWQYAWPNGGVYVYYGKPGSGIDTSAAPSTSPASATAPLFIPSPFNQGSTYGDKFGWRVEAGNINGAKSPGGTPCSDLVVSAPTMFAYNGYGGWNGGGIFVFYGSPSGLQTGTPSAMTFTCQGTGSTLCNPGFFSTQGADSTQGMIGFGDSIVVGDLDGDGYDDVVVAATSFADPGTAGQGLCGASACGATGALFIFHGTANGLSPVYQKVLPPLNYAVQALQFGYGLAMGRIQARPVDDNSQDLLVGMNAFYISKNTDQGSGAVLWIGNTKANPIKSDANGRLDRVTAPATPTLLLQPPQCDALPNVDGPAGLYRGGCGYRIVTTDFNQDGYDDIAFSATPMISRGPYPAADWIGAFFVYYGSAAGPQNAVTVPTAAATCSMANGGNCPPQFFWRNDVPTFTTFGQIGAVGDTNGDGYPDLGIGGPGFNNYTGQAYIYHGSSVGLTSSPFTLFGGGTLPIFSMFGSSITGANFSDPTGMTYLRNPALATGKYNDIAIGGVGLSSPGARGHGQVHVFANPKSGGFAAAVSSPTKVIAPNSEKLALVNNDNAVLVGDINGDGYGDVVATLILPSNSTFAGYAGLYSYTIQNAFVVYYGSPSGFITSPMPSITPVNATDPLLVTSLSLDTGNPSGFPLGDHIIKAGDTNGDGFNDVIIGDPTGLYLFYGSAAGLLVSPKPTNPTLSALDPLTVSVNGDVGIGQRCCGYHTPIAYASGDFNGDGYSDIATQWTGPKLGPPVNNAPLIVIYGSPNGLVAGGRIVTPANADYATSTDNNKAALTPNCNTTVTPPICNPVTISGVVSYDSPAFVVYGWGPLTGGGDMDGDGADELVVACPFCNGANTTPAGTSWYGTHNRTWLDGEVFIFYGSRLDGIHPQRYVEIQPRPGFILDAASPGNSMDRQLGLTGSPSNWSTRSGLLAAHNSGDAGSLLGGRDINGDGLADIAIGANEGHASATAGQGSVYIIYGLAGTGMSPTLTSGPYLTQGMCNNPITTTYPCRVKVDLAAGNTPTGRADQMVEGINNSCGATGCNLLRFWIPVGIHGLMMPGDLTGDAFSEFVVSMASNSNSQGISSDGQAYIYSGSANGLQVTGSARKNPSCTGGICEPLIIEAPKNGAWRNSYPQQFTVNAYQNASDVDGDGKADFLFSGHFMNDANGNGLFFGGFFLFH